MRVPFYLLSVAALMVAVVRTNELSNEAAAVAAQAAQAAQAASGSYYGDNGRLLEPLNVAADPETINYLLPRLAAKYRPNNDWTGVSDPRFYVLTEMESNDIENQVPLSRKTRTMRTTSEPSLSIKAPLKTLWGAVRASKMREQAARNRVYFQSLPDEY